MKNAIELIAEERQRQINVEGWTSDHDDKHTDGSIADAAGCYALSADQREKYQSFSVTYNRWYPRWWPKTWDVKWWKPSPDDRIRELVKAGALIIAEIERLQRLEK